VESDKCSFAKDEDYYGPESRDIVAVNGLSVGPVSVCACVSCVCERERESHKKKDVYTQKTRYMNSLYNIIYMYVRIYIYINRCTLQVLLVVV
jgi:hypothetical protein